MLSDMYFLTATFIAPEYIGTNPASMLFMFPLLAAIAIVYKATKMRVIFWGKFLKEAGLLFCTLSVFMVLAALAVNFIGWISTS